MDAFVDPIVAAGTKVFGPSTFANDEITFAKLEETMDNRESAEEDAKTKLFEAVDACIFNTPKTCNALVALAPKKRKELKRNSRKKQKKSATAAATGQITNALLKKQNRNLSLKEFCFKAVVESGEEHLGLLFGESEHEAVGVEDNARISKAQNEAVSRQHGVDGKDIEERIEDVAAAFKALLLIIHAEAVYELLSSVLEHEAEEVEAEIQDTDEVEVPEQEQETPIGKASKNEHKSVATSTSNFFSALPIEDSNVEEPNSASKSEPVKDAAPVVKERKQGSKKQKLAVDTTLLVKVSKIPFGLAYRGYADEQKTHLAFDFDVKANHKSALLRVALGTEDALTAAEALLEQQVDLVHPALMTEVMVKCVDGKRRSEHVGSCNLSALMSVACRIAKTVDIEPDRAEEEPEATAEPELIVAPEVKTHIQREGKKSRASRLQAIKALRAEKDIEAEAVPELAPKTWKSYTDQAAKKLRAFPSQSREATKKSAASIAQGYQVTEALVRTIIEDGFPQGLEIAALGKSKAWLAVLLCSVLLHVALTVLSMLIDRVTGGFFYASFIVGLFWWLDTFCLIIFTAFWLPALWSHITNASKATQEYLSDALPTELDKSHLAQPGTWVTLLVVASILDRLTDYVPGILHTLTDGAIQLDPQYLSPWLAQLICLVALAGLALKAAGDGLVWCYTALTSSNKMDAEYEEKFGRRRMEAGEEKKIRQAFFEQNGYYPGKAPKETFLGGLRSMLWKKAEWGSGGVE